MTKIKGMSVLLLALAMAGCASKGGDGVTESGKKDLSSIMYLRGQFAWWDALPEYQVKNVGPDLYMTSVELTADGNPYEMKFADAAWSAGTNCGYLSKEEDQTLEPGKKSKANCNSVFENFRFLPAETGTYNFYFDNAGETPLVYVESAK